MPLIKGKDYYQYGPSGKKYYYTPGDSVSREIAKARALQQGKAIHASRNNPK